MCIIFHSPPGSGLPDKDTLERCFDRNGDGAGYMWSGPKGILIRKGFMNWPAFWDSFSSRKFGDEQHIVGHFRIATSGGVSPGNCHPFPLTKDVNALKAQKAVTNRAVVHNGLIGTGDESLGLSDTMLFVRDILSSSAVAENLSDMAVRHLLAAFLKTSRLLVWDKDWVFKFGDWEKDNKTGIYYSNSGYLTPATNVYDWRDKRKNHHKGGGCNQHKYLGAANSAPSESLLLYRKECRERAEALGNLLPERFSGILSIEANRMQVYDQLNKKYILLTDAEKLVKPNLLLESQSQIEMAEANRAALDEIIERDEALRVKEERKLNAERCDSLQLGDNTATLLCDGCGSWTTDMPYTVVECPECNHTTFTKITFGEVDEMYGVNKRNAYFRPSTGTIHSFPEKPTTTIQPVITPVITKKAHVAQPHICFDCNSTDTCERFYSNQCYMLPLKLNECADFQPRREGGNA